MPRKEKSPRLEVLRMARDLVVEEYNNLRAEIHNRWIADSERLWKTQRERLPYPQMPAAPTEEDVLARARTLMEFAKPEEPTAEKTKDPDTENRQPFAILGSNALPSLLKKIGDMRSRLEKPEKDDG